MPHKSPFADVEIPDIDLWSTYMEQPRAFPDDHPLLIDAETKRSYSFADIKSLAIAFGQGLKYKYQWRKGDVLGFFSPNSIDLPVVNLGLHWAGGVASPANPTYTPAELARQLEDSGARALVTQKAFLQTAYKAAELAGLPREGIILLGDEKQEGVPHWSEITAAKAWFKPKRTQIDPKKDLAYLVYSSGTTGLPKGVMLTHYNVVANIQQFRIFDLKSLNWDYDVQLGVLPFFHIYGLAVVLTVTLLGGIKCILMSRFDLERSCQLIQEHAVTFIYVPPPIILALGKHPIIDKYDLSSLRFLTSAAAPLSKDLVDAVWGRLKVMVKQGYGLSETSPAVSTQLMDEWARYQGSVGKLIPNMEAKIVDPEGNELPDGESGELLVKGPNVFSGYWRKPELNKETFTEDGWYKTGDVMCVTSKGNYYITDRIKELIKYKGFQVAPAELEALLIGRKDIADVCVIGVWHEAQYTEVPRAYVVLAPGVDGNEDLKKDIIEWVNSSVSPPKKLRGGVRFIKEVPRSQAGKILRRVLRDQVKNEEGLGPLAKL